MHGLAKLLDVVALTVVSGNILGHTWAKNVYGALLVATVVVDAHVYEVVERSPDAQAMLVARVAVPDAAGIKLKAFDEFDPAPYRAAVRGRAVGRAHAKEDRGDPLPWTPARQPVPHALGVRRGW